MKKERSNLKLLSHILILVLCAVIAVVATFSWYSRTTLSSVGTTNKLTYEKSGNISGTGCTVQTYLGTITNGALTYDMDSPATVLSEPGGMNYFRTIITDASDSKGSSLISVYLENFNYTSTLNGKVKLGLNGYVRNGADNPAEKTYKKINSTRICLEDNIIIKQGASVTVDWFIEIDPSVTSSVGTISLGTIHVVYN